MLVAQVDGACEPINPGGTGSYGLVIYRGDCQIYRGGNIIGSGENISNNVAEYAGLLALLEWCIVSQVKEPVWVFSDSKLLIEQMNGRWKAKHGRYFPLYQKANAVIDEHGLRSLLRYQWIPRQENTEADGLSKEALMRAGLTPTYLEQIERRREFIRSIPRYHRRQRKPNGLVKVRNKN